VFGVDDGGQEFVSALVDEQLTIFGETSGGEVLQKGQKLTFKATSATTTSGDWKAILSRSGLVLAAASIGAPFGPVERGADRGSSRTPLFHRGHRDVAGRCTTAPDAGGGKANVSDHPHGRPQ
jgi:hypothetical protein